MALRIRKDGRILCAALHPEQPGDTYLDDSIHYYLSAEKKAVVTQPNHEHMQRGEWWWSGNIPVDIEIDEFYKTQDRKPSMNKYPSRPPRPSLYDRVRVKLYDWARAAGSKDPASEAEWTILLIELFVVLTLIVMVLGAVWWFLSK